MQAYFVRVCPLIAILAAMSASIQLKLKFTGPLGKWISIFLLPWSPHSTRAVTCHTCYNWVCLMGPWCNMKHERQCFIRISKHREKTWKYDAQQSIFGEIRGVWIADETLWPRVFDIHVSSLSKQKLRRKRRGKIVKTYLMIILSRYPNHRHGCDFLCDY